MSKDHSIMSFTAFRAAVLRRLKRYKHIYWKSYLLCGHDLKNVPVIETAAEIRLLQPGEEQALLSVGPLKLGHITERLRDGDLCYVAIMDRRFAAYLWVKTQGRHDLVVIGKMLEVRASECWLYTAWVAEWARKRGLYSAMMTHALQDLALRGFNKAWNEVATDNHNAIRALNRTGWKLNHRFRVIGLGPHMATMGFDKHFRKRAGKLLEE
jgi:ribosomal protein S18 acetylase RimI-like enzyme